VAGISEKGRVVQPSNQASSSSSANNKSGEYATFSIEKAPAERPAGTTWVFDNSSQEIKPGEKEPQGGDDFFEEFEKKTGGENFVKGGDGNTPKAEEGEREKKAEAASSPDDNNNDFMDKWEQLGGENGKKYS
jgi:hypothetical protein